MTTPAPPNPEQLKASYGFVTALVNAVPEIGHLVARAVNEQWTADRFQKGLADTNWWKTTPAPQREWLVMQTADPATAERNMATGRQQIKELAAQLGLGAPDDARAGQLWLSGKLSGYDEQGISAFVFRELRASAPGDQLGGDYGELVNKMQIMAAQYAYNPPGVRDEILRHAGNVMGFGDNDLAMWQSKLQNYAAAKYAPFADRIKAGETVQDIAQPYVDTYAEVLELNRQDVGLEDPYVQRWLQGQDTQGQAPPVWKVAQELRQDPRWATTSNARNAAAKTVTEIGRRFGFIG